MKKWIFFIFFLTTAFADNSIVLFVSPPRTGTHWMIYSIEGITHRFVSFWHRFHSTAPLKVPDQTFFGALYIDQSKDPILHTHYPYYHLRPYMHKGHKLLLIIRDHKEYLLRRAKEKSKDRNELIEKITTPYVISQYMLYFKFYEEWEEDKRLLIHYEDLMNDFETVMKSVLAFIGESDAQLKRFVKNLDFHKARLLKYYNRVFHKDGGAISGGKDIHFHSKDIPEDVLKKIDAFIQKKHPHYWETYLKRYQT